MIVGVDCFHVPERIMNVITIVGHYRVGNMVKRDFLLNGFHTYFVAWITVFQAVLIDEFANPKYFMVMVTPLACLMITLDCGCMKQFVSVVSSTVTPVIFELLSC